MKDKAQIIAAMFAGIACALFFYALTVVVLLFGG